MVYKTSAGVFNWLSPPCGQGSLVWAHLSAAHDRSPLLFPCSRSPRPLKFRIPTGHTMVARVFGFLAWRELLAVSRDVCPPRTWKSLQMQLAPWVSALTLILNGSVVPGPHHKRICPIAYKELFPVVVASYVWGSQWFRRHILFRSDNEAVVHILLSRMSKVPCIMRLLRLLLSAAARFNFTFTSQHIPGIHNNIADALSCFHWQDFRRLAPWAQPYPVPVPHQLWELLIPPL